MLKNVDFVKIENITLYPIKIKNGYGNPVPLINTTKLH
jgi:hypothetical protein